MKKYVACIGNFDGVHLAHQKLIEETVLTARQKQLISKVITFTPEPSIFYNRKKKHQKCLSSDKVKEMLFRQYGIEEIQFISFNKKLAEMSPDEFVKTYLNDVDTLVCGYDFTYGKDAKGNCHSLAGYSFELKIINQIDYYKKKISTTRILDLIANNRIKYALKLLNHQYYVDFEITDGKIITDNVLPEMGKLINNNITITFHKENEEYLSENVNNMTKMICILSTK